MMNGLGSSDASFAPASMAASFSELGGGGGSQKEQLWDFDSAAGLQSHLFCHQDPTMENMSTSLRFFPPAEYPYSPLGFVLKREEANVAGSAGQIGLNLGQRTYFSFSSSCDDSRRLFPLPKGGGGVWSPSHQPSRCLQCQAEGCKSDLSGAKHYHRRHKVCDFHSKATVVIAHGLQQRFCQQCSRFHVLEEFDEAKRSCRKRLADHNRRRRKPQTKHDADCSTSMNITPRTSGMTGQGDRLKDEVAVSQRGGGSSSVSPLLHINARAASCTIRTPGALRPMRLPCPWEEDDHQAISTLTNPCLSWTSFDVDA